MANELNNFVNPQVMAQMISASLPKKIKFTNIASVDTTLQGRAGNTITVPKFAYIGDAVDVGEGVAIDLANLTTSTTEATIKKAGKGIEITDEAVLSGYGDPLGEGVNQLAMSIASHIDEDCIDALSGATLKYDGTAGAISYDGIVKAIDGFEDENDSSVNKVMFIHPKQITQLRLDAEFKDIYKYPLQTVMTGVIGAICGVQVVVSKRVRMNEDKTAYINPIVVVDTNDPNQDAKADGYSESMSALTIYMKRGAQVETDRDILKKTTVVTADEHYAVVLTNDSKVILASFKA